MPEERVTSWSPMSWFMVTPPEPPPTGVERARVSATLEEAVALHPVTLVIAPAGSGKTTALSHWARTRAEPVAWLTLSRFDDDLPRVLSGVLSSLHRLAVDSGNPVHDRLRRPTPYPRNTKQAHEALLAAFETIENPTVLVIDDAHHGERPVVESLVAMIVDRVPPSLRVVISARPSLARSMARARLHGPTATVDAAALNFTTGEIEAAGPLLDRPVDEDLAADIHRATGGWPVAVRMALMSSAGGPYEVVSPRSAEGALLSDYVLEEILDGLPPDLVDFILAATTCSRLDVTVAAALSGRPDAAALMEECVDRGLFLDRFVSTTGNAVYQWHAVFAEQCRSILRRRDQPRADTLNLVAADQLAEHHPMEAVIHALGGQDPQRAARIIEDRWLSLIIEAHARLLTKACLSLPAPWSDDPLILLIRACCLDLDDDRVSASLLFDRASALVEAADTERRDRLELVLALSTLIVADERERLVAAGKDVEARLRGNHGLSPAMAACALFVVGWTAVRLRTEPGRAVQLLRSALDGCTATGQTAVAERVVANLAFALAFSGEFTQAEAVLATVADPARRRTPWLNVDGSISHVASGLISYWRDDLSGAWEWFMKAIRLGGGEASYAAFSRVALAWTAAAAGDARMLTQAQVGLSHVIRTDARGAPFGFYRAIGHALVAEAHGHHDVALSLARQPIEHRTIPLSAVLCADLLRRCGDVEGAMAIVGELEQDEQPVHIEAALLATKALVAAHEGDESGARVMLERSLDLAVPEEVRRPYLSAGPEIRPLLSGHAAWGSRHHAFVADLLARLDRSRSQGARNGSLSPRELEVLSYLQTPMSNAEIAEALSVSLNTIKTHQRSIFRKLGVNSRREAVRSHTAGVTPPG